jgi:hypothetical protein
MYVLIHKNRVIVGPMDWNRAMFDGALQKLGIVQTLPRSAPSDLPLIIDADTRLAESVYVYPAYNAKIEYLNGPFWNFDAPVAVGTFDVVTIEVDLIKGTLKQLVAAERYRKESAGTTGVVQGTTVTLDTSRGGRDIFAQAYLLMSDTDVKNWKFPEGWFVLTKSELGYIVAVGSAYIQACFDWERSKGEEIDACTTAEQLDAVVIVDSDTAPNSGV